MHDEHLECEMLSVAIGDITTFQVDAIVNAANSRLAGGGGVDGAIHSAAGSTVADQCRKIVETAGPCSTGNAVVTDAGDLLASWIIHTVGPVWGAQSPIDSSTLLARCYTSSLELASSIGAKSLAFASISTGVYGFPQELAAPLAVGSVLSWLRDNLTTSPIEAVTLVCFDERNYHLIGQAKAGLC